MRLATMLLVMLVAACTTRTGGDEPPPGAGGTAGNAGSGGAGGSGGAPLRTFPLPASIDLGGDASGVAVGDIDGDGFRDLAALVEREGSDRASLVVAFGDVDGLLVERFEHDLDGAVVRTSRDSPSGVVALGDLDADGRVDVATAAGIARGNGARTFGWTSFGDEARHAFQPTAIAKLDELVVIRGSADGPIERCAATGACIALPGQAPPCAPGEACAAPDLVIADFDGDSKDDVLGAEPVRLWASIDGWQLGTVITGMTAIDLEAGDVDLDGVADAASQSAPIGAGLPAQSELWLGTPGGTLPLFQVQSFAHHGTDNAASALADASFDSCLDLLRVSAEVPAVAVRLGTYTGDGCADELAPDWTLVASTPGALGIQQLDLNGDGIPEWVIRAPPLIRLLEIPIL